jgi:HEAT repeat protein
MSVFSKLGAAVWARRVTILVWAVILIGIFAVVSYNRAAEARTEAALNSPSQEIRDNEVLSLIQSGRLIDALAATQNPNEDAKSAQNVKSVTLRQNAAESVNRLTTAHRISDAQALDNLFLLRKDSDGGVKDRATAGLVALGSASQANEDIIIGKLKDGDPDIRGAAVDALSKIGGLTTAEKIAPLLKDPAAQDSAQSVLQNIGAASVPLLTARLADPDIAFRQRIVSMLGTISSPLSVPDLTKVANSDQASVRRLALVALANTVLSNYNTAQKAESDAQKAADPKAKPEDVKKAKDAALKAASDFALTRPAESALRSAVRNPEDDSEARTQGALALGRLGSPADVAVLVGVLGDYDSRVALAALQGVQSVGPPAVGPLTAVLSPQQPEQARAAAAQALGGIGTGPAVVALQGVLADKTTPLSVRRSAVIGLGQSGSPAVIPALVASLSDTDGGVASAASDALLAPALEPSAIPLLIDAFTKPTPVPFLASETLSRMGNMPVRALETAASSAANPQAQQWAAIALGQTDSRDPAIAATLTPLTKSTDPDVQYAATQALNRLSGT